MVVKHVDYKLKIEHQQKQIQESNKTYQPNKKNPFCQTCKPDYLLKSDLIGGFSFDKKNNIRSGGNHPWFGGKMNFACQIFHLNALRMRHIRNITNVAEKRLVSTMGTQNPHF